MMSLFIAYVLLTINKTRTYIFVKKDQEIEKRNHFLYCLSARWHDVKMFIFVNKSLVDIDLKTSLLVFTCVESIINWWRFELAIALHNRRIEAVKIAVIEISWKPVFQFFSKNGFLIVKIFLLITEIELIWLFQRIGHNELMIWEILRKVVLTLPSMLFFALKFDSSLAK